MNRNEQFAPLEVTRLDIHLTWPDLEVFTDDTNAIQVLIAGDENSVNELRVNLKDGALEISQPTKGINYHINQPIWLKITVLLPRDWKGKTETTTVSGNISICSLAGTDISLESASGQIRATDVKGIEIRLISVSGDVNAENLDCETCIVRTVSGDVKINAGGAENWRLTAVSGDININMNSGFGKLAATSVSGDVRVSVPVNSVDAYIRSVSGRIRTNGIAITDGAPNLHLSTVSGDLDIRGNL